MLLSSSSMLILLKQSSILSSVVLGMVVVFGSFNRITFPAFLLIPGLVVCYYWQK